MARTWQDNAREFGALVKQGKDVRLALLVACSLGRGQVSTKQFALASGTSAPRIARHLEAWNGMAARGYVPAAGTLNPADAETFGEVGEDVQQAFAEVFTEITDSKPTGGRPRDSRPEDAVSIIDRRGADEVVGAMPATTKLAMLQALERDPDLRDTVGDEWARKRREHQEREARHPDALLNHTATCRLALDALAKVGAYDSIQLVADYATGLLAAGQARDLTPEMFDDQR
jgi:hypothetical protein